MASPSLDQNAETTKSAQGFVTSRGLKFPKDRNVLPPRIIHAMRQNLYEAKEADVVRRLVRPRDVVMELGGGIGYMSSLAARACHKGRVHTYEANPNLLPYMRSVHEVNKLNNIEINNALLGSESGRATFYVRSNFLSSSQTATRGEEDVQEVELEVRNAREECERIKPTIFICDIEGAEADVLPAMDLSTVRSAVIELHPQNIGSKGIKTVFEAMQANGLTYFPRLSVAKVVCFKRDF